MALGTAVANDIAAAALDFYLKSPAFAQSTQDRPLLGWLDKGKKTFPSGKEKISSPVKGDYMNSVAGFFSGYSEDSQLSFKQAQNIKRAEYSWKEVHAGLIITWTELKKDGITVSDNAKTSQHTSREATVLTGLLEDRMADFAESWARAKNAMLWADGSQDANQVPGIQAIIPAAYGTVGGIDQNVYAWWKHQIFPAVNPSGEAQTLVETIRAGLIQLRRYGGRPNKALCGSAFLAGLRLEVTAKSEYSDSGNAAGQDIGMGGIRVSEMGLFEYDPTMDDIGLSKKCYVMDGRRVKLRPMEGEDNKILTPERPHDYMVFLKSMTWTGGLEVTQLNANGIFSIN